MYLGMFILDFVESYTHGLVHCFCFYIEHIYYVENTTKSGEFSWLFGVTIGHNVHHLAWSHHSCDILHHIHLALARWIAGVFESFR